MNVRFNFVHLLVFVLLSFEAAQPQSDVPQARIVNLTVNPQQVLVLHLQPGYVSSVRVLEEVSSVVLGDPGSFKAEHSDAEPQLVFFKTTTIKPARTNALIATKTGREISLSLVSTGKQGHGNPVDYVLNCERPRSFLISPTLPSFLAAETKPGMARDSSAIARSDNPTSTRDELLNLRLQNPHWEGKSLRIAVGQPLEKGRKTVVPFAVLNAADRSVEILPPQIELASSSKDKKRKGIKAEPVPVADYAITTRSLAPRVRADGVVVFERPTFKESGERLMLSIAEAAAVDRPIQVPVAFVAPASGGTK